jgi:hypothetical protein
MTFHAAPEDILDVLACEIDTRPKDAPTFQDLAPAIQSVEREDGAIVVHFAGSALDAVRRLAAAEQQCCSTIGWTVDDHPLRLRITALPHQLDTLESMLTARP